MPFLFQDPMPKNGEVGEQTIASLRSLTPAGRKRFRLRQMNTLHCVEAVGNLYPLGGGQCHYCAELAFLRFFDMVSKFTDLNWLHFFVQAFRGLIHPLIGLCVGNKKQKGYTVCNPLIIK